MEEIEEYGNVEWALNAGKVKPKRASTYSLGFAIDWLGCYDYSNLEEAQELANAIGFLQREIIKRNGKKNR